VHNGTITWETLPPLSSIESIEVVRGSASALHGDAAVAGVINIVTRRPPEGGASWRVGIESDAGVSAAADFADQFQQRDFNASVGFDRTDGYRDHAARTSATARASMRLARTVRGSLRLGRRDFEDPGPLLASLRGDGTGSDPRFRNDGGEDREWNLNVDHDGSLGAGGDVHSSFRTSGKRTDLTRTLPLSPDFGDTKDRELRAFQLGITSQTNLTPTILPAGVDRFSFGFSADLGTIDSRYFSTSNDILSEHSRGDGYRGTLGAFAHVAARSTEWLRWTFGARLDLLRDEFEENTFPGEAEFSESNSHFAFSPKMGINVRYAPSGRAWISASRTFKAPTLDQQFDRRPIPVPFPPFEVTTSNPELEPQRGTSAEAGLYHDLSIATARAGLTLTVYEITMRNELDFDVQTLRYVNIARSRHRGTEAGLNVTRGITSAFASVSLQSAISRAGANEGKQLKAVPGQVLTAGATVAPPRVGIVSLSVARMSDMFIDDANTERIPAWTRVDAQFSRAVGAFDLIVGARNLLDADINSTAFLDPSGSGEAYYYPAAGRVLVIGVRHGR
jgi:iron complex outermembrane receptor protein